MNELAERRKKNHAAKYHESLEALNDLAPLIAAHGDLIAYYFDFFIKQALKNGAEEMRKRVNFNFEVNHEAQSVMWFHVFHQRAGVKTELLRVERVLNPPEVLNCPEPDTQASTAAKVFKARLDIMDTALHNAFYLYGKLVTELFRNIDKVVAFQQEEGFFIVFLPEGSSKELFIKFRICLPLS